MKFLVRCSYLEIY
jgi:hypothetical protein